MGKLINIEVLQIQPDGFILSYGKDKGKPNGNDIFEIDEDLFGRQFRKEANGTLSIIPEAVAVSRRREYPSVGDQLDAIWKLLDATTEVAKDDPLLIEIKAVKDKYPKI
jgi:hypothetical protein